MQVPIIGIGAGNANYAEYLSVNMLQQFTNAIIPLKQVFTTSSSAVAGTDYDTILSQIALLGTLAKSGVTDTNGETTFQSYMNQEMVKSLNEIMRTFALVGIPPPATAAPLTDTQKIATVHAWQSLSQFGIDPGVILNNALDLIVRSNQYTVQVAQPGTGIPQNLTVQAYPTRTLLSLVQTEYLSIGNQVIGENLGQLQQALSTSQQVLNSLTAVQNIANQLHVINPQPAFVFPPANTIRIADKTIAALIANNSGLANDLVNGTPVNSTTNFLAQAIQNILQNGTPTDQAGVQTILSTDIIIHVGPVDTNIGHGSTSPTQNNQMYPQTILNLIQHYPTLAFGLVADYEAGTGNTFSSLVASKANGNLSDYKSIYKTMASSYFSQIIPSAIPAANAANDLLLLKQQLYQELLQLEQQSPDNTRNTSGTLAASVFQVIKDISTAFSGISTVNNPQLQTQLLSAVKKWILDGQDVIIGTTGVLGNANAIGNNLTNAISVGENLEETQKDAVTRALFLFNEFYKSAYALVQIISQMIESINKSLNK